MIQYIQEPIEDDDVPGYYKAVVEMLGQTVDVSLNAESYPIYALERILEYSIQNGTALLARATEAVTRDLLDLYNDNWRCYSNGLGQQFERPLLDATAFVGSMTLRGIHLCPESIEFEFDDGDLFFGHIVVSRSEYTSHEDLLNCAKFIAHLDG